MTRHAPLSTRPLRAAVAALLLAASVIGIPGCSVLPPQAEAPALHVIDAMPPAVKAPSRRAQTLEVGVIRAAPGCDTPAMMYTTSAHALEPFARNRWADAPARMLAPLLLRALEDSDAFAAVVQGPSSVPADWRLDVDLLRLQQDFTQKPSRADIALRVQLVDLRARRVVMTRYVETSAEATGEDPQSGVVAINAAVAQALGQVAVLVLEAAR